MGVDGDEQLCRLAEIAESFGAEHVAGDARSLAERVAEGRFYVACVGQFKRGKSTLLDALIGEPVLPTGIVPVTAVPTVVRYGERRSARIRVAAGGWMAVPLAEIEEYVSEERNPENTKHIAGVEVFIPSPLLATGMCFVDTPGLGSVFAGNTAATRDFIPHIDAAIVVIGADPPISGDELAVVETVAAHVQDLVCVVNKADRVTERELATATAFARRMLELRLRRPVPAIYEVSAIERLEERGPGRDWDTFVADLQKLAEDAGQSLTLAAKNRGLRRIADQLLRVVDEELEALLRPVEESQRRISAMRTTIADAERSLNDLTYLLIAEQHRLSRTFAERRAEFLNKVQLVAQDELSAAVKSIHRGGGPRFRREAMSVSQDIARKHVVPWLAGEQAYASHAFRTAAERFADIGNDFLRRLSEAGVSELAALPRHLDVEQGFRTRSRFHFHGFITIAQPASPLRWLADLMLGIIGDCGSIKREAEEFLDRLLESNSMRVQSDVDRRVSDGKSRLETDIRILLREVAAVAERALSHAQAARQAGAAAIEAAMARIQAKQAEIQTLTNQTFTLRPDA